MELKESNALAKLTKDVRRQTFMNFGPSPASPLRRVCEPPGRQEGFTPALEKPQSHPQRPPGQVFRTQEAAHPKQADGVIKQVEADTERLLPAGASPVALPGAFQAQIASVGATPASTNVRSASTSLS